MQNSAAPTAPAVDPSTFPNAVAKPLVTYRLVNEAGYFLCKGFQGVMPRFTHDPGSREVADFPSEHVALRVAELLTGRLQKLWAEKGNFPAPLSYLPLAWNWKLAGEWWPGRVSVDETAISTAQLELGHELIAPCRNGAGS